MPLYPPPSGSGALETPVMLTGQVYASTGPRGADAATTSNKVYYARIRLRAGTLDRLTFFAGSGTTATRLGIYEDDGTGEPGTLLLDAGTVAVAGAGQYSITISQIISGTRDVWLALVTQGGGNTLQRHAMGCGAAGQPAPTLAANTGVGGGWVSTGTEAGALPATAAAVTAEIPFAVGVRYSA